MTPYHQQEEAPKHPIQSRDEIAVGRIMQPQCSTGKQQQQQQQQGSWSQQPQRGNSTQARST